jgi:hypothetical protein
MRKLKDVLRRKLNADQSHQQIVQNHSDWQEID